MYKTAVIFVLCRNIHILNLKYADLKKKLNFIWKQTVSSIVDENSYTKNVWLNKDIK